MKTVEDRMKDLFDNIDGNEYEFVPSLMLGTMIHLSELQTEIDRLNKIISTDKLNDKLAFQLLSLNPDKHNKAFIEKIKFMQSEIDRLSKENIALARDFNLAKGNTPK